MRATGRDIVELFGYAPDDRSSESLKVWESQECPFVGRVCDKTNHDGTIVYGACSVTYGASTSSDSDVIICPSRLYCNSYLSLKNAADVVWGAGQYTLVVGGDYGALRAKALQVDNPVVAFGHYSGREVSAGGNMSIDWVLQKYEKIDGGIAPVDFIGIEVQSIDITGNYRDCHEAYTQFRKTGEPISIPNSGHGLNWANVHKRLLPQIIRKGNLLMHAPRSKGLFFVVPEVVYCKFEEILGAIETTQAIGPDILTIMTYRLEIDAPSGRPRALLKERTISHRIEDVALAFVSSGSFEASRKLDSDIARLLVSA